mgnify:CR=1 FL=1
MYRVTLTVRVRPSCLEMSERQWISPMRGVLAGVGASGSAHFFHHVFFLAELLTAQMDAPHASAQIDEPHAELIANVGTRAAPTPSVDCSEASRIQCRHLHRLNTHKSRAPRTKRAGWYSGPILYHDDKYVFRGHAGSTDSFRSRCHTVLLSSQFWPMWSKSRQGVGQLPIGRSSLSG